ncbi:MAG: hypothetical protein JXN59_05845 [Anaerolineae bacterium]|nr:hypothetical protein [Anaerolineae bacterium]
MTKRVIYDPPSPAVTKELAAKACAQLGIDKPDVVRGLSSFLAAVAQATTNNLNRAQETSEIDNENE